MAFFDRLRVLSLRQMAMTRVAITVCCDPEIVDFMKDCGIASFIFPSKETHLYLNVENPVEESWMWNDLRVEKNSVFLSNSSLQRRSAPESELCVLPFAMWEELVEKKISSLPKILRHELLEVARSVNIAINKWIKYPSEDWRKFSENGRCAQYNEQWNRRGQISQERIASTILMNERLEMQDRYFSAILFGLRDKMPNGEPVPHKILQKFSNLSNNGWSKPNGRYEFSYVSKKQYFITLSSDQRSEFVKFLLWRECLHYEDFRLYVSNMRDDERKKIFTCCPCQILLLLLEWPFHCEFLNVAEHLFPYFTKRNFLFMLNLIIYERIMLGRKDFNYIDLLNGFWSLSPSNLKESIKTDPIYEPLMFIVNFPVNETFPGERLLESYKGDDLKFTCYGAKYRLMKQTLPVDITKCLPEDSSVSYSTFTFSHLFFFEKILKDNGTKSRK